MDDVHAVQVLDGADELGEHDSTAVLRDGSPQLHVVQQVTVARQLHSDEYLETS